MNRICPLCSFDNTASPAMSYSLDSWLLKDCGQCGLVYLENPPAYSVSQDQWAREKTSSAERERRRSAEPFVQRLSEFVGYLRHRVFKRDKLTPLALREIIRRAGFKTVRFSLKDRFPFSDNMWAVCQSAWSVQKNSSIILQ